MRSDKDQQVEEHERTLLQNCHVVSLLFVIVASGKNSGSSSSGNIATTD